MNKEWRERAPIGNGSRAHTIKEEDEAMMNRSSLESYVEENDGSSRSTSDTVSEECQGATSRKLAHKETVAVFRLRVLVILVLFIAAITVSIIVYFATTGAEQEEFESQFEGVAAQVMEAFEAIVRNKVGAITSLAVATIDHGVDHQSTWPFVALSSFHQRAAMSRSLSRGVYIALAPVVAEKDRHGWEDFVSQRSDWMDQGFRYQEGFGKNKYLPNLTYPGIEIPPGANRSLYGSSPIVYKPPNGQPILDVSPGPYLPIWQTSPVLKRSWVNRNMFLDPFFSADAKYCLETGEVIIGGWDRAPPGYINHTNETTAFYSSILSVNERTRVDYHGDPFSVMYVPIFNSFDSESRHTVAVLLVFVQWARFFHAVLAPNVKGVTLVLKDTCNGEYSYTIRGEEVLPIGPGDHHDKVFDSLEHYVSFDGLTFIEDGTIEGLLLNQDKCKYSMSVYPSHEFEHIYRTKNPISMTLAVAFIFAFTAMMFLVYDRLVERRQSLVVRKATQTSALVSSLFPENVRDRLMNAGDDDRDGGVFLAPNHRLKTYLKGGKSEKDLGLSPIADLFPHSTVMFADIAGFTAWSSTREPAQVFILLQTLYQDFDIIAKKLGVFKVETIGDSYVAVTGLPEPQANHALIMAKFARECLSAMSRVTSSLDITLGPGTADLGLRIGMHSGPVTAGVLRGERARFQLFGDTVNTAARMESTGVRNRIQTSQSTADLLHQGGKSHWVKPREDSVIAKGKGVLKTFWLETSPTKAISITSQGHDSCATELEISDDDKTSSKKLERHIDWITELCQVCIKKVVAMRRKAYMTNDKASMTYHLDPNRTSLDEVAEVINLPRFDAKAAAKAKSHEFIELDPVVVSQIREYVSLIASMYRDNPFHNFEHACHVTMAVSKLLKRIVAPDLDDAMMDRNGAAIASHLHDYTHGINSDPLTIFGIILSALIHDVDHRGVSNQQLIKEEKSMAEKYRNQSVAEQNSLDSAWELLMSNRFKELRACIFSTQAELLRFRQVMVNVVLATDIFDKELNDLRKNRWDKAFSGDEAKRNDYNDLRATIVIEHIIQASDVAHTMQHWHVYCKWNRRLFREMYAAYQAGRMSKDPSTFWYAGELGFFDNYIIPLAKKLKDCNVFGVSSDECLNYALRNRAEWEERGKEILNDMIDEVKSDHSETHAWKGSSAFRVGVSESAEDLD